MADKKLTRNQRRQIEKLAPYVEPFFDADIAFFEQHPDRRYHVRRAGDAEIAQAELVDDQLLQPPDGWCWFAIVMKLADAYVRMFVVNDPTAEPGLDAPDDILASIWEEAPSDVCLIIDVVTAATDGQIMWERMAGADPIHFPRAREESARSN